MATSDPPFWMPPVDPGSLAAALAAGYPAFQPTLGAGYTTPGPNTMDWSADGILRAAEDMRARFLADSVGTVTHDDRPARRAIRCRDALAGIPDDDLTDPDSTLHALLRLYRASNGIPFPPLADWILDQVNAGRHLP